MFLDFVIAVQKRIWLVALCFVMAVAVAVVMLVRQVPVYRSSASVALPLPERDETELQYQTRFATRLATATASPVVAQARNLLGRPAEELATKIVGLSAERVEDTTLVRLNVDALDPVLGSDFANAWAASFLALLPGEERKTASIVEEATPSPRPISPNKMRTIHLAAVAGLLIGLVLVAALNGMERQAAGRPGGSAFSREKRGP